jgi:L-lactate dehydrogenase (cytochrome)
VYGLAAAGEEGVTHALELLTADVRRTMALIGARSIAELSPAHVAQATLALPESSGT